MEDTLLSGRPVRKTFEEAVEKVPKGPAGVIGEGNLFGAVNYFTVSFVDTIIPVNGIDVGFNVESSSVTRSGGVETHTFRINASNKEVAQYAAKYLAAPSNIDFISERPEVVGTTVVKQRGTLPLYEVTVKIGEGRGDGETTQAAQDADSSVMT